MLVSNSIKANKSAEQLQSRYPIDQRRARDDLIAKQLLERQRLQTQIDQARKDHLRQTQNLHRDLSRFKERDLSAFQKVDKTGGVHERPQRTRPEPKRPNPPQQDGGLAAQCDTFKTEWQQASPSPQERLEKMRDQAVERGSIEQSREDRLAAFKEQRLRTSPQRDGPTRER